jgi:diadenosine tetraphosphate (Ap4A) HIT family hydrolase
VDYDLLKIKSYEHWALFLHENQCYLGRVFLLLKDASAEGIEDFMGITGAIREEFFLAGEAIKSAQRTLFEPDKMNYAALSNTSPKIHVHMVPRYKTPRVFEGVTFEDARWGSNYAPYERTFNLDTDVLYCIRDALGSAI